MEFMVLGVLLVGLALYLRLRVFIGTRPGGVDTWYYLAWADALRRQKRLPISLPRYLLHDRVESYPAVFPLCLALLPPGWLKRYFWLLSPLIDALHLLVLYFLTFRLTDSVLAAATAGLIYALTPQLISETRNLNGRAFASLLQTLAMVTLMRALIAGDGATGTLVGDRGRLVLLGVALLLIALLYNTHTSTTIAFLVGVATLSVVTGDVRYVLFGALGLPLAILLSGGYYLRVIGNHLHAARFWRRNVGLTRAHQVEDSPLFAPTGRRDAPSGGLYGSSPRSRLGLAVRVVGENPFILAMLVAPVPANVWGAHMYWWAVGILVWSVATTFGGPLRILGPGFHYMKASVFPSAYALAVVVNVYEGAFSLSGLMLVVSLIGSLAALSYFYRYMARRQTEHTAQTPPDLAEAAQYVRTLPVSRLLVLPSMYADYLAYASQKAVVWGGHSGNLDRLHEFYPVIRRPLDYFFERYDVDCVVLDLQYTTPERLGIRDHVRESAVFGPIAVYQVVRVPRDSPPAEADTRLVRA